jgi:hypothetical protein
VLSDTITLHEPWARLQGDPASPALSITPPVSRSRAAHCHILPSRDRETSGTRSGRVYFPLSDWSKSSSDRPEPPSENRDEEFLAAFASAWQDGLSRFRTCFGESVRSTDTSSAEETLNLTHSLSCRRAPKVMAMPDRPRRDRGRGQKARNPGLQNPYDRSRDPSVLPHIYVGGVGRSLRRCAPRLPGLPPHGRRERDLRQKRK